MDTKHTHSGHCRRILWHCTMFRIYVAQHRKRERESETKGRGDKEIWPNIRLLASTMAIEHVYNNGN